MTSIHAPVPNNLKQPVSEAKHRGEDPAMVARVEPEQQPSIQTQETRRTGLVMKTPATATSVEIPDENMQPDNDEDLMDDDYKENDPSLSPEPIITAPSFSRKSDQEKRPLSVLSTAPPRDTDVVMYDSMSDDDGSSDGMTSSERNIAANNTTSSDSSFYEHNSQPQQQKTSAHPSSILNTSSSSSSYEIYEDSNGEPVASPNRRVSRGKENLANSFLSTKTTPSSSSLPLQTASLVMKPSSSPSRAPLGQSHHHHHSPSAATKPLEPTKVTKPALGSGVRKGSAAATKRKPRIGLRRL